MNIEADVETVERCLDELGICFCFAPLMHPSMKHVAAVRRRLNMPTIFNLLGPLCNPAAAPFQLLGVGHAELRPQLSTALQLLGTKRAAVVIGRDGLDEVTLNGSTDVTLIEGDSVSEATWSPPEFGCTSSTLEPLQVDGPAASAALIPRYLEWSCEAQHATSSSSTPPPPSGLPNMLPTCRKQPHWLPKQLTAARHNACWCDWAR